MGQEAGGLTKRHSAKSLHERDQDGQRKTALAWNLENNQHDEKDETRLTDENRKLIYNVSNKNLGHLNTCNQAAIDEALFLLAHKDGSRQRCGNKVNNPKIHFNLQSICHLFSNS